MTRSRLRSPTSGRTWPGLYREWTRDWCAVIATRHGTRRAGVVGAEVITARHRDIALLVAGYFMEMPDGTTTVVP